MSDVDSLEKQLINGAKWIIEQFPFSEISVEALIHDEATIEEALETLNWETEGINGIRINDLNIGGPLTEQQYINGSFFEKLKEEEDLEKYHEGLEIVWTYKDNEILISSIQIEIVRYTREEGEGSKFKIITHFDDLLEVYGDGSIIEPKNATSVRDMMILWKTTYQ